MDIEGVKRWWALIVLCMGSLMIVLDITVVNVALPSIKESLAFSDANLAWVVNAYTLTFGGFLLLGGRLGDIYGHRRLFLIGIVLFTLASLLCGIAGSQWFLIGARAIQGFGGAIASAVALSLMMTLFQEPGERARAMGVFGFVAAGGGSIGVLLGGVLTNALDWHSIFLINLPIGALVVGLTLWLIPKAQGGAGKLDVMGAVTITLSLLAAVYAVVNGNEAGWGSLQTLVLFAASLLFLISFIYIEKRISAPLIPLSFFKLRNVIVGNTVGVLWAGAMFSWFFLSALYLQLVLNYTPLEVGLAFLPANLIMALFSVWLSAKIVMRFGLRLPIAVGLGLAALGLFLFARAPLEGAFLIDVLPSMILLGIGAGMAFNPVLLAVMSDAAPSEAGLASGIANTAFMAGGALGLAILVSLASGYTSSLLASGIDMKTALNGGYHASFLAGAIFATVAAALGGGFLRVKMSPGQPAQMH